MHEIERAVRKVGTVGVAAAEFNIAARTRGRGRARVCEELLVHVETDNAAGRTGALAHQIGDATGAAADVEARPSRRNPDAIEHHAAVGRHGRALDAQPLDLARTIFDRIVAGEGGGHRSAPFPKFVIRRSTL
jgi:hypothetical protein